MNDTLLWDLAETARQLGGVSTRTVRRLLDRGDIEPRRVGRRLLVTAESVRAYVDDSNTASDNRPCAGLASQTEESAKTKTGSTVVPIRRTGGLRIPTDAASELAARLGLTTEPKRK
jgi:excisionase family DNA binding protein